MTSAKFSGFWTPSLPLSVPNSRNLPSFGQKMANPLPPVSADVICTSPLTTWLTPSKSIESIRS